MDIGGRLIILRKSLKISQGMLAKSAGVSQSSISFIENGTNQPTIAQLEKLCTAIGITLAEFFAEDQKKEVRPLIRELLCASEQLADEQLRLIIQLVKDLKK